MASKVIHMIVIKWSKTSRNIAMIKIGVILKYYTVIMKMSFLYPFHLSYLILIKNSIIWWLL